MTIRECPEFAQETCDALRQQLAASTAREERLRDALDHACDWADDRAMRLGNVGLWPEEWYDEARAVLGETAAREAQP